MSDQNKDRTEELNGFKVTFEVPTPDWLREAIEEGRATYTRGIPTKTEQCDADQPLEG